MSDSPHPVENIPPGFKYREAFLRGRPAHTSRDSFLARHPRMETDHRAKLFAPFDALRGFSQLLLTAEAEAASSDDTGSTAP